MMRVEKKVRAALASKKHSHGLSCSELAAVTDTGHSSVSRAARRMPDVYIDRWEQRTTATGHRYLVAVFCLADIPPDAEHPKIKPARQGSQAKVAA